MVVGLVILISVLMRIISFHRTRAFVVPLVPPRRQFFYHQQKHFQQKTNHNHHHHHSHLFSSSSSSFENTQRVQPNEFLQEQSDVIITYLTDVEGDKLYLDRYVELSRVLEFCDSSSSSSSSSSSRNNSEEKKEEIFFPYSRHITFSQDNAMLIYGGDLWDKGGFDLYVARQLLDLKRRFPSRVFFVCGNRDMNKLRILQEMGLPSSSSSSSSMPKHPGIMWLAGSKKIGDPINGPLPSQDDPPERLKWILGQTMGSPDAFELRKQELEWENNNNIFSHNNKQQQVTDMDVVQSYRHSCHPKGEMGQFLFHSNLALKVGPIVVVHGSLPLNGDIIEEYVNTTTKTTKTTTDSKNSSSSIWDDLSFCMPWIRPGESAAKDYGVTTIDEWIDALNQFCHDKVKEWNTEIQKMESDETETTKSPKEKKSIWAFHGGYDYGPSYSSLIQYGMGMTPDRKKNPTVVYNTFTPDGMPQAFLSNEEGKEGDGDDDDDDDYRKKRNNLLLAEYTREFFDRAKIQLILAGHKPQGDMPSPIRVDSSSWVLCCDTSYSGETVWINDHSNNNNNNTEEEDHLQENKDRTNIGRGSSLSFRGEHAVSEVLIHIQLEGSKTTTTTTTSSGGIIESVKYHGVLSDGQEYETVNLLDHANNSTIGQVAPFNLVPSELESPHQGRWWTKSIFSDGSKLFHAGQGFNVWNYYSSNKT